ncbi:MAG: hypothetical protein ABIJ50_03185 [Pseudomonadota bacterium]
MTTQNSPYRKRDQREMESRRCSRPWRIFFQQPVTVTTGQAGGEKAPHPKPQTPATDHP